MLASFIDPQRSDSEDSDLDELDDSPRCLRIVNERTMEPFTHEFSAHPQCVSLFFDLAGLTEAHKFRFSGAEGVSFIRRDIRLSSQKRSGNDCE